MTNKAYVSNEGLAMQKVSYAPVADSANDQSIHRLFPSTK
jgi:hypothetical protein